MTVDMVACIAGAVIFAGFPYGELVDMLLFVSYFESALLEFIIGDTF